MINKKCLLVIDVQNGMFGLPVELYKGKIKLDNIYSLIKKARAGNALIVYMQHYGHKESIFGEGSKGWRIHPKISPLDNDVTIKKKYSDSFLETTLDDVLKNSEINDLVVCGFVTEGCVDTTIRRAFSLGYNVEVAGDCHSTTDNKILTAEQIIKHHNEVFKMFSKVRKSEEIIFKE